MQLAVHATARFFDHVVEETLAQQGRPVVIGGAGGAMSLPVRKGQPYLARVHWKDPRTVVVRDAAGVEQVLSGNDTVTVEDGPIRLELRMVRRFRLRRMASTATMVASLAGMSLLSILVGGLFLTGKQVEQALQVCAVTLPEVCPPERGGGGGLADQLVGSDRMAEYLERVLKKDLAGEDEGVIARGDRQHGNKADDSFYMPAGDKGDPDRMGGAKERDLRPVRTAPKPIDEIEKPRKRDPQVLHSEKVGTPIQMPGINPGEDEELVDEDDLEEPEPIEEEVETLKEDREGWGIRDWYDQEARQLDDQRIDAMKDLAHRILRIDPNDSQALSLLAYYQYLNEELDGAEETYDRFIELNPEEAAGYNNKALIFKRRGEYEAEERLYRIALTLQPNDVTAMNNLAVNLSHQGRHEEALDLMRRLEVLDPGEPYADLHRAKIHAEMGNDDEALRYLELALQGMKQLDTLHHIEFRQDIRVDPSFRTLRSSPRFRAILWRYYGDDSPLPGE